ncbi:REP element-mobilizing transposase RayT [Methanophagales archaeon]|nr:REP element-mobilizing transposase RayT [Methanophagales archaeon]
MEGEVAEAAEESIRETYEELDIEIIEMAESVDHVHIFIKNPFRKSVYGKMLRSPPKYSVSWIAKRIKGMSSKLLRDQFPQLKVWCPDHLWAPSCYHKTFQKSFIKNASQSVGQGWEVVEKYISGQKGYEKADTVPVIAEEKEKRRTHKTWYTSLYVKFFGGTHQKKKSKSFYIPRTYV